MVVLLSPAASVFVRETSIRLIVVSSPRLLHRPGVQETGSIELIALDRSLTGTGCQAQVPGLLPCLSTL
jgi:hypothetical protein